MTPRTRQAVLDAAVSAALLATLVAAYLLLLWVCEVRGWVS